MKSYSVENNWNLHSFIAWSISAVVETGLLQEPKLVPFFFIKDFTESLIVFFPLNQKRNTPATNTLHFHQWACLCWGPHAGGMLWVCLKPARSSGDFGSFQVLQKLPSSSWPALRAPINAQCTAHFSLCR